MVRPASNVWLAAPGGPRARIRAGGVLIGRAAECDVVVGAPSVSRVQAIVHLGSDGATLVVLGQAAMTVNDRPAERVHPLVAGDVIGLEDRRLEVMVDVADDPAPSMWMLADPSGQLFGVTRSPFVIGGLAEADLSVAGWPPAVVRCHLADALHVEALVPVTVGGVVLEPGEIVVAALGATIAYGPTTFTVAAGGPSQQAATATRRGPPARVALEFLPRGGRLSVGWGEQESLVYLPDRRCDLVALLLQPPPPHVAGDLIPDDVVLARLWPGQSRTRSDLNVVIHRTRADLLRAQLDGARLVQRATGGRGTRFDVDAATTVTVL